MSPKKKKNFTKKWIIWEIPSSIFEGTIYWLDFFFGGLLLAKLDLK
jgi:hypothetical protein